MVFRRASTSFELPSPVSDDELECLFNPALDGLEPELPSDVEESQALIVTFADLHDRILFLTSSLNLEVLELQDLCCHFQPKEDCPELLQTPRSSIKRRLRFSPPQRPRKVKAMTKSSASAKKCQATSSKSMPVKKSHVKQNQKQTKNAGKKLQPIMQDSACMDNAMALLAKPKMRPHDIMEFYSCPRLVPVAAQKFGLRADVSLDLVHGWDALKPGHRKIAHDLLWHLEPGFLMTSPPCTFFSPLMPMWNFPKMTKAEKARRKKVAHQMVDQAVDSCLEQHRWGRLFCFEHPIRASSWSTTSLAKHKDEEGTFLVCFDQCSLGLVSPMKEPMMKRTRLWTNCEPIVEIFSKKQCRCVVPHRRIEGSQLGIPLSKHAQKYPPEMVKCLISGAAKGLPKVSLSGK